MSHLLRLSVASSAVSSIRAVSTTAPLCYRPRNRVRMNSPNLDDALLDKLFPAPTFSSAFTSPSAPTPNAGITPESTAALTRLLKENHKRFHIFFNDRRFHNHLSHHLFAAYGLGAPAHVLQAAFDEHASYQRPAYKSPKPVTRDNWIKHLGDEDFYNAYMNFFSAEIKEHGLPATLERFVFSYEANWGRDEPRMLDRFLAGLVHPLIHFGHGPEFGVEGMAIEGLAQTAAHQSTHSELFDASFFSTSQPAHTSSDISTLTSTLTSALALTSGSTAPPPKGHTHAFTILARILADERLEAGKTCKKESQSKFDDTLTSAGHIIREYASLWTVSDNEKEIQERVEELAWFVAVIFGMGGWKKGRNFRADFFLAHFVTSDLFIPSVLSLLKPQHQADLLRAYFAVALVYFVARGRPAIDPQGFFESVSADPKPNPDPNASVSDEPVGNPWYTVLAHTVPHKDEHHVKAERALAHGAALYGTRPKGFFSHTELKGAEAIDGSLFVRVGGLLIGAQKWGRVLKGKTVAWPGDHDDDGSGWDFSGVGWD